MAYHGREMPSDERRIFGQPQESLAQAMAGFRARGRPGGQRAQHHWLIFKLQIWVLVSFPMGSF